MSAPGHARPLNRRSVQDKRRQLALIRGTAPKLVPAAPTIAYIRDLRRKYGYSHQTIATLSGISAPTISALDYENHHEHRTDVWETTASAILAVQFSIDGLDDKTWISSTGTTRRLKALGAIGWSATELATRLGVNRRTVSSFHARTWTHVATYKQIAALYDELSMTPGPSNSTRIRAQKKGWPPPLAWNDDQIEDPDARPYGMGTGRHGGEGAA